MLISEMTLEQLQDYAVKLEAEKAADAEKIAAFESSQAELVELNKALQRRNNELFMKVEQQPTEPQKAAEKEDEPVVSCEELAETKLYKEIIK